MTNIVADTDLRAWLPRRQLNIEDAVTNTVTTLLTLDHSSTGTVAANFGLRLLARLEDASGNAVENAGALDFIWADATGASEDCDLVISLKTAGAALAERHRFSSTGVYTPTGGVNLNNTDLTGVKDVYGSASANHVIYANAAVTDATERSLTMNVLNATGDAWLAMITLTPNAAAPTMSFNSRPVSGLTLGGAMDANSQNLGTIGTATLSGTIAGGAQTINNVGLLLIGSATSYGRLGQSFEIVTSNNYGGISLNTWQNTAGYPIVDFNRAATDTIGQYTVVGTGEGLGAIMFRGADGTDFQDSVYIYAKATGTIGNNRVPGLLEFRALSDAAPSEDTVVMTLTAIGLGIGTAPYAAQVTGSLGVAAGVMIGASSLNNLIDDASNGAGSAALYIGNALILKNNGVNFGPAAVVSITVVGGQITAIS